MSRQVVGYTGEGRLRQPVYRDEGPASASAVSPMAELSRLATPGLGPSGGAGPIERRQINEAERDARRPATDTQREWNGRGLDGQRPGPQPDPAVLAARTAPQMPQEAAMPTTDTSALNPFGSLADAAVRASEAYDRKRAADIAWEIARDAVTTAYSAVCLAEVVTAMVDSLAEEPEPEFIPPVHPGQARLNELQAARDAEPTGGWMPASLTAALAKPNKAERDAQSRRNGQASMRKVVDAKKPTGTTGQKRTPEQRERMRQGQLASSARRKAAQA